MTSIVKKNSEEKNNESNNTDINGRIEYIDQSLRSVDNRIRAVEKRLSIKTSGPDAVMISPEKWRNIDEVCLNEINEKLNEMHRKLSGLELREVKG